MAQERELAVLEHATQAAQRRQSAAEGAAERSHTTNERIAGMSAPAKPKASDK
jgi:hypothetical protein